MPERIVLVHVKAAGNADGHAPVALHSFTVEEQFVLFLISVNALLGLARSPVGKHFLASVTRIVFLSVIKLVTNNEALVVTAIAMEELRRVMGLCQHIVKPHFARRMGLGIEGAAVRSHQLGYVATGHLGACQHLEGTHHGVVTHSSALHHDMLAKL